MAMLYCNICYIITFMLAPQNKRIIMEARLKKENDDFWTTWAYISEIGTRFVSTGYAIGEAVDVVATDLLGAEKAFIQLSIPGLIVGVAIGAVAAGGAAYVHKKRNNRKQSHNDQRNDANGSVYIHGKQ